MKKQIVIIFISLISLISFTSFLQMNKNQQDKNTNWTEKETVINDREQLTWICDSISEFWAPNESQMRMVESILQKAVKDNSSDYWTQLNEKNLKNYYRQYSFYKNQNNELIVYINAFCEIDEHSVESDGKWVMAPFDWKNEFLMVLDGGDCYWSIKINLTKESYFDFIVNGVA